ncbi:MAG: hypothetical protein K1Y36_14640 [Blastocatellia bacterium]|nr:hypothetical protein [Blastocatellia bacterium]
MKTRKNLFAMLVLTLACVLFAGWSESAYAQKVGNGGEGAGSGSTGQPSPVRITMLTPAAGSVFTAGQTVNVTWTVDLSDKNRSTLWDEQEIRLIVDGKSYRLTRELGGDVRSYNVVLPNVSTNKAYFDISYGSQGNPDLIFEAPNVQKDKPFTIQSRPTRDLVQEVTLEPIGTKVAHTGDVINLKWSSTVANLDVFEVLVSYDRGAHYFSVATTADNSYNWVVPGKQKGTVTFKIVARSLDGSEIESLTEGTPHLRIK